ncbi:MAG: hypothetical protein HN560_01565 [Anaerolineae bacterium]|nr:hypothetical protein [Anaerolineae bacterium]
MIKKFLLTLLGISMIIIINGCDMPADPLPAVHCPPDELIAPQLITPYNWSTVNNTTPNLSASYAAITYPYPLPSPAYDCFPQKYHFYLSTAPGFTDELGAISNSGFWYPASPLQPGEMYRWAAAAISENIEGPMSSYRYFFVGDDCATSEMVAPILLEPADGAVIEVLRPTLTWDNPLLCHPTHYWVDLSTDPFFPNIANGGQSLGPMTSFEPSSDLANCETYYWRVKARGDGLGESGPFSEMRSFHVQTPGSFCPAELEIPEFIETVPPGPPDFLGIMNANCRSNPWINGNEVGMLAMGQTATLMGLSQDGYWGFFKLKNGRECWLVLTAVEMQPPGSLFDPSMFPLIAHDPKPEETAPEDPAPVSCNQLTDYNSCVSNSACAWDRVKSVCHDK